MSDMRINKQNVPHLNTERPAENAETTLPEYQKVAGSVPLPRATAANFNIGDAYAIKQQEDGDLSHLVRRVDTQARSKKVDHFACNRFSQTQAAAAKSNREYSNTPVQGPDLGQAIKNVIPA